MNINFCGLIGEVTQSSPHGNYLVIRLSKRVTVCTTHSNQWGWEEIQVDDFVSFITYIGVCDRMEAQKYSEWAIKNGGYFKEKEKARPTKRGDRSFPLELKVRGLSVEHVCQLVRQNA